MKIAYLNCTSGISGDMLLAGLVDCGASWAKLKQQLAALKLPGLQLTRRRVRRGHIRATQISVRAAPGARLNSMASVLRCLGQSKLPSPVQTRVRQVFTALAEAEAVVHGETKEHVHFHQLGDVDTIVDITGCVLALDMLNIERVYASAVVVGTGQVSCGTEVFPVPAPAVLQLLKGRTLRVDPRIDQETVTPTGAALVSVISREAGDSVLLRVERTGYGAGTRQFASLPNVLTVMLGQAGGDAAANEVCLIEATIDDMLPLGFQPVFESLLAKGALDVCTVPVMMKKQRPGVILRVMAPPERQEEVLAILFQETTTLGARIGRVQRRVLERKILKLKSEYGIMVDIKLGIFAGNIVTVSPEYEQCRSIARRVGKPFKTVYDRVKAQALQEVKT